MKKILVVSIIILMSIIVHVGCTTPTEEPMSYKDISAADAWGMIGTMPDIIIVDVSPLYGEGHLPGAVNYYVGDGSLDEAIPMLDMDKTYLVYCHTDEASMLGAQKLVDAGFKMVYRLEGNYGGWIEAGYPYVTQAGYIDISAELAKEMIDKMPDVVIVDVSPLYGEGHLPGAVNYYVGDGSLDEAIPMLDMDKTYLVYCHTDEASMLGAQKLVDAGFKTVYRLEGNYGGWIEAGYPYDEEAMSYTDISAADAWGMIGAMPDIIIVDVSPLYGEGHLPGAVNYYVGDGSLDEAIPMLDMDKTYLVYCHTDEASMLGAQKLVDAGFKMVYRLEGNYGGWIEAGYPYVTQAGYIDISTKLAKEMIDEMPDVVIVDVSPLYGEGHLPGAVNYYVGDGSLDDAIPMLDMDKTYLVYCHTDEASMLGARKFVDAGFMMVYRLEGNYGGWVDAGYEVEMNTP